VTDLPVPRLPPRPRAQWDDAVVAALRGAFPEPVVERFLTTGPDARPVPNALATFAHHPTLTGPWLTFNNVLLWEPALDHRQRELMVLCVAWRTRSWYEWVQHVLLAPRFAITDEDVQAIAAGAALPGWTRLERSLLAATDQLVDHQRVDDATWSTLAEHLDERQLVEVVFVVGTYTCLAMAFNSFELQLEPGLDTSGVPRFPD